MDVFTPHKSEQNSIQHILGYKIDTTTVGPESATKTALLLHGAGASTKHRLVPLARALAQLDYRCLSFSFPGHGESSGTLLGSSLHERSRVADAIATKLGFANADLCVGVSMGAHVASSLLEHSSQRFASLALLVPAAYHRDAHHEPFGPRFSSIIRKANSFHDASIWQHLQTYTGNLITIQAGKDAVIPQAVIDLYHHHSPKATKQRIVIPESKHMITTWTNHQQERVQHLAHALDTLSFDQWSEAINATQ